MNKVILTIMIASFAFFAFTPIEDEWNGQGDISWKAESFKTGYKAEGGFTEFRINSFELPGNDWTQVKAEIEVNIASVFENSDGLVKHLKEADFFDAENFPTAVLYIDGAEQQNDRFYSEARIRIKGIEGKARVNFSGLVEENVFLVIGTVDVERNSFEVGIPYEKYGEKITKTIVCEFETEINR